MRQARRHESLHDSGGHDRERQEQADPQRCGGGRCLGLQRPVQHGFHARRYSGPNDPKPYDEKDFDFPLLRQFHLVNDPSMRPETDVKANRGNGTSEEDAAWLPCKPTTGHRFTAVGLYFGRKLQMETGIPIGLIKTAWNGTRIEPWISPAGLAAVPELPAVTGLPAEYKFDGGYPSTWHCLYYGKIHPLTALRDQGRPLVSGRIQRRRGRDLLSETAGPDRRLADGLGPRRLPLLLCPVGRQIPFDRAIPRAATAGPKSAWLN